MQNDCCLFGRKFANDKQDTQHFIQLDQLNLDRKRRTNTLDHLVKQTNLVKLSNLFSKIHLNKHFYTNSSACEIKDKLNWNDLHLPANNEECQFEFTNCCLDEQLQFAIGIDLALRSRFKQQSVDNNQAGEIENYNIASGNEIRSNCNLLASNRTNSQTKLTEEQLDSIKLIRIGQNIAFDTCEACALGIQQFDQFENCNNLIESDDQKYLVDNKFFKQCCRVIHLSVLAKNRGLITLNSSTKLN